MALAEFAFFVHSPPGSATWPGRRTRNTRRSVHERETPLTRQDSLPSASETRRVLKQRWDFFSSVIETSKAADSRKQRNL